MLSIMMIMMMLSYTMIMMNHPLSLGLILIAQTMLTSMVTGMSMKTFWMSYILLITMLSGMLVLFIYMSSIASNEKFSMSNMNIMVLATPLILFLIPSNKMIIKDNYLGLEMEMNKLSEMMNMNKLFMMENTTITLMLIMYLFYTMIVSTKLIDIYEGPMRSKNYE